MLSKMKLLLIVLSVLSTIVIGCGETSVVSTPSALSTVEAPTSEPLSATPTLQALEPIPESELTPPVLIEIPAAGLLHTVVPMTWEVAEVDGRRTTVWRVPEEAAGWHIDSANAGAVGNVILSGHQEQGEAVFKAISLGSVSIGQEVNLTDGSGNTFVYRISEISEPIPLEGVTADQLASVEKYYAQSQDSLLTLITGWPDFTTTHRLFVQAEMIGRRS